MSIEQMNRDAALQSQREEEITARVLASLAKTEDARLKEVLGSAVRHLHAFVRDVRLTEDEWEQAIAFLTAVGHITDDRRQEFVMLSDVLGVSMQMITVNNEAGESVTEATVLGPFFVDGSPLVEPSGDISFGASGEPCWVEGTVRDTDGAPVPGARLEVWEADDQGFYDVQRDDGQLTARGHLFADDAGTYRFWCLTPTPYPIPSDGPVGALLRATRRSVMRASHLHFKVSAPGFRPLTTHIFVRGDELLDTDAVFGVRQSLIRDFDHQPAGTPTPDGRALTGRTWTRTRFDIVLAKDSTRGDPID